MNEGINEMYIAARTATLNPSRNVEQITNEIIFIKQNAQRVMLATYIELGKRLTEAKGMLNHGEWLPWLKEKVQFSRQSAERFMLAYREYGEIYEGANSNCSTLSNLSISNALALLAVPEEEREAFAAEVDAEHISTRELEAAIKAKEEAEKALEDAKEGHALAIGELEKKLEKANEEAGAAIERAEDAEKTAKEFSEENVRLTDDLAEAERRVKELESRPVEVAVQEPGREEIDKAVAEALRESN